MENCEANFAEMIQVMSSVSRRKSKRSKRRGRPRGSGKKINAEMKCKLGKANLCYARGLYQESISLLKEVVRVAPNAGEPYHILALSYTAIGERNKALNCYMLAACLMPKPSPLWRFLVGLSIEHGNAGQAMYCLSKAIKADPSDLSLRFLQGSIYMELEEYKKAADSYAQISNICPDNVEALLKSSRLFLKCSQVERAVDILENYLRNNRGRSALDVVDFHADICIENCLYEKPIPHIEAARLNLSCGDHFPLSLCVKEGICNVHVGNVERAEALFSSLLHGGCDHPDMVVKVADSYMSAGYFEASIRYYSFFDGKLESGGLHQKIAKCYLGLNKKAMAIGHLYKALEMADCDIEARLNLVDLLEKEGSEGEALSLLLPPERSQKCLDGDIRTSERWWMDSAVRWRLCQMYRIKGMTVEFVGIALPYVWESLFPDTHEKKERKRKRQSKHDLLERVNSVYEDRVDTVLCGFKPFANSYSVSRAARAKKLLQKKEKLREQRTSAASAAGVEWETDDSEFEDVQKPLQEAPHRKFLEDDENMALVIDLCKALASLERYEEAIEIVNVAMKLVYKLLCVEKRAELERLAAQIACKTEFDHGLKCVKYVVEKHPRSLAAWNCYYRAILRSEPRFCRHSKFLCRIREGYRDCVPAILISGHQFSMISHHQAATREYLEAYKLMPEDPLINLCVGTSLINLALGFRLQNKHQCVAQGLAFLFNNLRLLKNGQEALFNIGRACHHVGLLSLAVMFYEKVLRVRKEDHPIPKLPCDEGHFLENGTTGFCDLRKEAAYNLHLIYKNSGAIDLARQVLKDYCSF